MKEIDSKLDRLKPVEMEWLQVFSEGWAYPLSGFMRENEYLLSLHFNCIKRSGIPVNRLFYNLDNILFMFSLKIEALQKSIYIL